MLNDKAVDTAPLDSTVYAQGSIKTETLEIEIPESCQHCGFKNLKIQGNRTKGRTMAEVRCMRCGKKLTLIEKDERL